MTVTEVKDIDTFQQLVRAFRFPLTESGPDRRVLSA